MVKFTNCLNCTGGSAQKGNLPRRVTVTLSIFNFRTWFFAQIIENRETRLSRPILGPRHNFFEKLWRNPDFAEVDHHASALCTSQRSKPSRWTSRSATSPHSDTRNTLRIRIGYWDRILGRTIPPHYRPQEKWQRNARPGMSGCVYMVSNPLQNIGWSIFQDGLNWR